MKKILFILFFGASLTVKSQNILGAGVGLDVMAGETDELNTFVKTFNNYYGSSLSKPLKNFGLTKGYSFTAGGYLDTYSFVLGAWISRGNMFQKSKAVFTDNREVEMVQHLAKTTLYTDYGWWAGDNVIISGTLAASLWRNDLRIYSIYSDGTKSIGNDNFLNGIYSSYSASFDFGLNVSLVFEPIKIDIRALKDFKVANTQLSDLSAGKGIYDQNVPIDYTKGTFDETNRMHGGFSGYYFSVSVIAFLFLE